MLSLVVGDLMSQGMPAALMMSTVRAVVSQNAPAAALQRDAHTSTRIVRGRDRRHPASHPTRRRDRLAFVLTIAVLRHSDPCRSTGNGSLGTPAARSASPTVNELAGE